MTSIRAIRVPLALAALSVVAVLMLNDIRPSGLFFGIWAYIAAMLGFSFNSALATYRRSQRASRAALPVRSATATVSSLTLSVVGFILAVAAFGYMYYVMSAEFFNVMQDPLGLFGWTAFVFAALSGLCCGAVALFYIASPSVQLYRATLLFTFASLVATFLFSVVSYQPIANSAATSHSAGAHLAVLFGVFVFPSIAIVLLALHFLLIRSIRQLIDLPDPSA